MKNWLKTLTIILIVGIYFPAAALSQEAERTGNPGAATDTTAIKSAGSKSVENLKSKPDSIKTQSNSTANPDSGAGFQEISPDSVKMINRFGIYGNLNLNLHSADFKRLPGVPNCCPRFLGGSGGGFTIGALYEYPLTKEYFLSIRGGYSSFSADLTEIENTTVIVDNKPTKGKFEHILETTIDNIGLEPLFGWRFYDEFTAFGGLRASWTTSTQYVQMEKIIEPKNTGTFMDGEGNDTFSRVRGDTSGVLPESNPFQVFLLAGASYDLPLNSNRSLVLSPEVMFSYGLQPIVADLNWTANQIRVGASLKYTPLPKPVIDIENLREEIIDTVHVASYDIADDTVIVRGKPLIISDTLYKPASIVYTDKFFRTDTLFYKLYYELNASIEAVGVDSLGNEIPSPVYVLEEFLHTRLSPLLNYVFFENNSSVIREKYTSLTTPETKDFYVDNLYKHKTMPIYYHILNIVGRRMLLYEDAELTLVGCNSDLGEEKGNLELSENRAEAVKKYLVDNWEIPEERIQIKARNLPELFSGPIEEPDKIAENRRVELYSDNSKILDHVFLVDTVRTVNPPIARFKPRVKAEAGLKSWDIKVIQGNEILKEFSSTGEMLDELDWRIIAQLDWDINSDQGVLPSIQQPLEYRLGVIDQVNQRFVTDSQYIPIKLLTMKRKRLENLSDKTVDRYSLILFDFDKAVIKGRNQQVVELIKSRIWDNSSVSILGYTDRTGDSAHNQALSLRRALSTAKAINQPKAEIRGFGSQKPFLYDNDLPEGRFYCRTVDIKVETIFEEREP